MFLCIFDFQILGFHRSFNFFLLLFSIYFVEIFLSELFSKQPVGNNRKLKLDSLGVF